MKAVAKLSLRRSSFSKPQLVFFALVFAAIGGYIILRSFASPNPNLPGDLNGDNTVAITDLSILLSNYGTTNPTADINLDGTVNILDLSILLSHWGQSYTPGGTSCSTSSTTWQNNSIATQSGSFTANFNVIPNGQGIDGVTGFSNGPASAYANLAAIIRFNASNVVDAINGANYQAVTPLSYTAGQTYAVRVVINITGHTFSAYVTPPGASEVTIANNYAFRTEQATVSQLSNWALISTIGSHQVCSLTISGTTSPPPPPASGNKYPPLALVNPITINITNANAKTAAYSLDNTKDYNIKITEVITSGVVAIRGGRNVNLIGGEWNISNASTDVFWDHGGIVIYSGASGRIVHIEGVYIHGPTLNDGIVWNAAGTIVEIQTVRIGPNADNSTGYHPDGIQNQGDIQEVRLDKLTINTVLQANFWGDHSSPTNTPMGPIHTSRVNMIGSPGKILFWKSANWAGWPPVTIENSWMYMANPWTTNIGYWVYPSLDGDNNTDLMTYPWIAVHMDPNRKARVSADGNYVDFPNSNITGGFNKGIPPGGDFVPASTVGMGYISP